MIIALHEGRVLVQGDRGVRNRVLPTIGSSYLSQRGYEVSKSETVSTSDTDRIGSDSKEGDLDEGVRHE